jgi:hypothetical protein
MKIATTVGEKAMLVRRFSPCTRCYRGVARWVRLGELNLGTTEDKTRTQEFSVAKLFRHPGYVPPAHYNDIAILQLDRNVKFDGYVRPACLHVEQDIPAKEPEAVGWGLTGWSEYSPNDSRSSDLLVDTSN